MTERTATASRSTAETDIEVTVALDGDGESAVDTGIGFFDHMLASFATHGLFDLTVECDGDLHVDDHHTVEDVGIVVMHADDLDYLSRNVRETVETSVEPTFVTIGGGAGGSSGMREQIKRAIGIDLMGQDEGANE